MKKLLIIMLCAGLTSACSDDKKNGCAGNVTIISEASQTDQVSGMNSQNQLVIPDSVDSKVNYSRVEMVLPSGKVIQLDPDEDQTDDGKVDPATIIDFNSYRVSMGGDSVNFYQNVRRSREVGKNVYDIDPQGALNILRKNTDIKEGEVMRDGVRLCQWGLNRMQFIYDSGDPSIEVQTETTARLQLDQEVVNAFEAGAY